MEKITTIQSIPVIINEDNIDTDQIIPARFLKAVKRVGISEKLFFDKRFDANGVITDYPVNFKKDEQTILVGAHNFGCGSSREHAVWAIYDFGFRSVIAKSFSDIFLNNALNNGLLPVKVSSNFFNSIIDNCNSEIEVNLKEQTVTILKTGATEKFVINEFKRHCLLSGYDNVDVLVSCREEIYDYEKKRSASQLEKA